MDLDLENPDSAQRIKDIIKEITFDGRPVVVSLLGVLCNTLENTQVETLKILCDSLPKDSCLLLGIPTHLNPPYYNYQSFIDKAFLLKSQLTSFALLYNKNLSIDDFPMQNRTDKLFVSEEYIRRTDHGKFFDIIFPFAWYFFEVEKLGMKIHCASLDASVIGRHGPFIQGYFTLFAQKS